MHLLGVNPVLRLLRLAVFWLLLLAPLPSDALMLRGGTSSAGSVTWAALKIGAGGFLTGISIASDNTMAVRTDSDVAAGAAGSKSETFASAPAGVGSYLLFGLHP
jgi:hypothetical protein